MKKRLVSGIKPTGKIHLGNYLGAIKNWIELQNEYESYYFIANLHALTTVKDKKELKRQTRELLIDLISLGLDPKKAIIFKQSDVIGHTELSWIFNCLIPVSELERMTQYKDLKNKDNNEVFVFNGWTFSSSPTIKPFDHPIYDIWLTKCY